jgi:predicted DNA-binding protein (MmcQ/YjbR family)
MEECDDLERHAESRGLAPDALAGGIDGHVRREEINDRRAPAIVDQDGVDAMPCGQCPLDDEISLCDEQSTVVATGSSPGHRERAIAEMEMGEPRIVGVGDGDHRGLTVPSTSCPFLTTRPCMRDRRYAAVELVAEREADGMPSRPATPSPHDELLRLALEFPGAWEDHPWGDTVVKVGKKIFVFIGEPGTPSLTVKLPDSAEQALMLDCAAPCAYGLGKWGWVSVQMDAADCPPVGVLADWLDESYRAIAPKRLVKELDEAMSDRIT